MPATALGDSYRWLANPYAFLDEERTRRGTTFWLHLLPRGRALVTGDPALIREIAANRDLDAGKGIAVLDAVLGERSLITLDGGEHLARRQIVGPPLRNHLKALDEGTLLATRKELRSLRRNQEFSAYELVHRISLRLILRALFGDLPGAEIERAAKLTDDFSNSFRSPLVLFLRPLHVVLGGITPWARLLRRRRRLGTFVRDRIRACGANPGTDRGILGHILAGAGGLPEDEVVSEVLSLLMFGHDTGAVTMAWAFYHLWSHPEVNLKIREECRRIPPVDAGGSLSGHVYLEACLKESMRLCPVVVHLTRVASRPTRIGEHRLPEGTRIYPCAYLAHRDPAVFPRPDEFRPERFLEGGEYPYSYFPFGLGSRTCVGKDFVSRQMLLILSTIVRETKLEIAEGYEGRPVRQMVLMAPVHGTRMVAREC
jgi:cytochrome P450